jgi:hypothetical protein
MILTYQILAILAQVLLLAGIVHTAAAGGRTIFLRVFNPGCWMTFYYVLWFLIPQLVSITNDNFVLDVPGVTDQVLLRSQLFLTLFLTLVGIGILSVRLLFEYNASTKPARLVLEPMLRSERWLIIGFYIAGFFATIYLGNQLLSIDGMRSELVKTPTGLLATTVSFFGIVGMAVLLAHSLYDRQLLVVLLVMGILGGAIFFTGARGRLLWPVVLGVSYVFCRANQINYRLLTGVAILGLFVLLVFDPILNSIRSGHFDAKEVREKVSVSNLFMAKRNFDGFANFTRIITSDSIAQDATVFRTGARKKFMEHYYPEVFKKGVGFGTTFPGMLWIGGKFSGLITGSFAYGAALGLIGFLFRRIQREPMFWSYMFAMTWFTAIGGNFQESLDKLVAVALPGFVWLLLAYYEDGLFTFQKRKSSPIPVSKRITTQSKS